nr:DNA primase [Burkholderiaceae bacterium]
FDGDSAGRRAARKALDGAIPFATDVRSVKFLFLPAEHDPDSFIREFGKEAFARYVSEATPLSRFLLDAAREGCDLNTIEGRSHFASNVAPLWSALPEGALKRQLLSEIADLVQLSSRELTEVWQSAAAAKLPPQTAQRQTTNSERYQNNSTIGNKYAEYSSKTSIKPAFSSNSSKLRTPAKTASAGRADHAARILLSDPALWDSLSHDDHAMLCEPATPAGQLLVWFEAQMNEHGVQPWGALREGLRDHELESLALRLMAETENKVATHTQSKDQAIETQQELRALLDRMHIDRLKVLEAQTIEAAKADPTQLQRYKEIHARRKLLTESLASLGDK